MPYRTLEEFIALFNARRVRYLIVGGYAVSFHARPRFTKDLDVLVDPDDAGKVVKAVTEFCGADLGFSANDIARPDMVHQIGRAPVRIDIMSSVPAVSSFAAAFARRAKGSFGEESANYMALEDLIRSKRAIQDQKGRELDRKDVRDLERALARRKRK